MCPRYPVSTGAQCMQRIACKYSPRTVELQPQAQRKIQWDIATSRLLF